MPRILYVTPLWSGLEDLISRTNNYTSKGMPAFIEPLKRLSNNAEVILFIFSSKNDVYHKEVFGSKIIKIIYLPKNKLLTFFKIVYSILKIISLCFLNHIDFIYCHGSIGSIGVIAAKLTGTSYGQRLYGTFLFSELKKGRLNIFCKHPLESIALLFPGRFLIITNDGTKGDLVFKKINRKNYNKFFFWLNGVDIPLLNINSLKLENISCNLLYPARIDPWKGQIRAIDLLYKLRNDSIPASLIFLGHIRDNNYFKSIFNYAKKMEISQFVEYGGLHTREQLSFLYRTSLAVLSFYDYSNLGNVTIETLASGGRLVALKDGSLNDIITNGINGFLVNTMEEAFINIKDLYNNFDLVKRISKEAIVTAKKLFLSWDDRSKKEVELILKSCIK